MARQLKSDDVLERLWERTYDDPDELAEVRELCLACVEAVVEAALGDTP